MKKIDESAFTESEREIIKGHKKVLAGMNYRKTKYFTINKSIELRKALLEADIKYHELMKTYYSTKITAISPRTRKKNIILEENEIIRLKLLLQYLNEIQEELEEELKKLLPSSEDERVKQAFMEIVLHNKSLKEIAKENKWGYSFQHSASRLLEEYTGGLIKRI